MTAGTVTDPQGIEAPPVHAEPCVEFVADADASPVCATCGWEAADHTALDELDAPFAQAS
jgi:hypothetical protein